MRIAVISTLHQSVPPKGAGSIETLVHLITEGLAQRGHEVTLFATADSQTHARLRIPVSASHGQMSTGWDWQIYEAFNVSRAFKAADEFDVIHCHSYHHGLLHCDLVSTPSLHSIHVEPGPDIRFLAERTHNRHLIFCSQFQAREFSALTNVHVIPHGVAVETHQAESVGPHLVFLGRFIPDKGPLEAVRFARAHGLPLLLAGEENDYYKEVIQPEVDGELIRSVGMVDGAQKATLLAGARAMIYPCQRSEPFGLVLTEASACGLPVLALNRGAVPEIIEHGVTGWLADSMDDLAQGLNMVDGMDRSRIRRIAMERFSVERMVDRFENLMREVVST